MLRDTVHCLSRLVREANAPFPVHDGTRPTLAEHGVAYLLVPRQRRVEDSSWFDATLWAQTRRYHALQAGGEASSWDDHDVLLLVHWPMLLRLARTDLRSPMKAVAHRLLRDLVPLIEEYDLALALLIKRCEERWTLRLPDALDMPLFFGQASDFDERRFDAHLERLLGNKSFRHRLDETMQRSLTVFTAKHQQLRLGLCEAAHRRGHPCDVCEENRWVRRYTSVLWPNRLNSPLIQTLSQPQFSLPGLWPQGVKNPWYTELRYWASLVMAEEGVARVATAGHGESMLVDFGRLLEVGRRDDRESPPRALDDPGTSDFWVLGNRARQAFAEATKDELLARRPKSLKELVEAQGWDWRETLDLPYELISVFAVSAKMSHAKRSTKSLRQTLRRVPSRRKPRFSGTRIITLEYRDVEGRLHGIAAIRRNDELLFSTPQPVVGRLLEARNRRGLGYRIGETVYWSARGINRLTGNSDHPWAEHFREWAIVQAAAVTKERFNELFYEQRYSTRILRYQEGKQAHLSRFVPYEDQTITAFFFARGVGAGTTKEEWAQLLERLPGRSIKAVQRRLEELGKQYAREHGWAAYCNSPLCLRKSSARRKRWLKEGIR